MKKSPISSSTASPSPDPFPASQGRGEKSFPSHRGGTEGGMHEGSPTSQEQTTQGAAYGDENISLPRFANTRISQEIWEKLKPLTRDMRKKPTPAEDLLWQNLRRKQLRGYKFRRQHPVGHFVVDFYCADAWLVIEVDGEIHAQQQEYDELRQAYIESLGLRVLRFNNEEVLQDIETVLGQIVEALEISIDEDLTTSPHIVGGRKGGCERFPDFAGADDPRGDNERGYNSGCECAEIAPKQPNLREHFAAVLPCGTGRAG